MALYDFIDVTDFNNPATLPKEALSINGEYLENSVEGYRTLSTTGRELIGQEISSEVIGTRDGALFDYSRTPDRVITVRYQLKAKTAEEFREAYNKLNKIIRQPEAQLIFNDENDKYFIGTLQEVSAPDQGSNIVTGEFSFYCADPYKYAVNETVVNVTAGDDEVLLSNDGTGDALINIEATMSGDNGYIGGAIGDRAYQQGIVEQPDTITLEKSEVLMTAKNFVSGNTTVSGVVPTAINVDTIPDTNRFSLKSAPVIFTHASGMKTLRSPEPLVTDTNVIYLGGGLKWAIPNDSQNRVGATNWRFNTRFMVEQGKVRERGLLMAYVMAADNTIIARIIIDKNSMSDARTLMRFRVNEKVAKEFMYSTAAGLAQADATKITSLDHGRIGIQKSGGVFTFTWHGGSFSYRDDSLANKVATQVAFYFGEWILPVGSSQFTSRDLIDFNFIKDNSTYAEDIPNFFADGDVWKLDSTANLSYINGSSTGIMRDIGSQPLLLPVGDHYCYLGYSSWATVPNWKVSYRKRWL